MLLKVSDLAASTKLTVRTLHHYDSIGLLKPSARSEANYRLYSREDVARLHAILALRQLGLPLADIVQVFAQNGPDLPSVLTQQVRTLRQQVAQSKALLTRLELLQTQLAAGMTPHMDEWLGTLARMSTYGKYFSPSELKYILMQQTQSATAWSVLFADVRAAMAQGIPPDAPEAQPLAQRWLGIMFEWMGGNFEMMTRWSQMYRTEPTAYGNQNPSPEMVEYITIAIDLRTAAFLRHMSLEELKQIRPLSLDQWGSLARDIEKLGDSRGAPKSVATKQILQRWAEMALDQVGRQSTLLAQVLVAIRNEPLLQVTEGDEAVARQFLRQAMQAHGTSFTINERTA